MASERRVPSLGLLNPGRDTDYGVSDGEWLDVDWREHQRWVQIDGRQVNYAEMGSGPVLLLVHGLGAAWQCWVENIPEFARDHRVIAMDLPGFGYSEMPEGDISIEYYAQWLGRFADALGVSCAAVVGNSMGGFVAAEVAIRRPELVERLSLVSAAIFWQEYRRAAPLVAFARATDAYIGRAIAGSSELVARRPRLRAPALVSAGIRYPHRLPPQLASELVRSARRTPGFLPALEALAEFPLREELPKISCPTLIVWGAHDHLVGVRDAAKMEESIPDARRVVFGRTGHVPMVERPKRFNRVLREFLEEGAGERGPSAVAGAPAPTA